MKQLITYINPNKDSIDVEIQTVDNPVQADHWRYVFNVTDRNSGHKRTYQVMVLKSYVADPKQADAFVLTDPVEYLRHVCLDSYAEGSHQMFWPDLTRGWIVY